MNCPWSYVTTYNIDSRKNQCGHGKGINYTKIILKDFVNQLILEISIHSLLFLAKNILSKARILWDAASSKHFCTVDLAIVIDGLKNLMKLTQFLAGNDQVMRFQQFHNDWRCSICQILPIIANSYSTFACFLFCADSKCC